MKEPADDGRHGLHGTLRRAGSGLVGAPASAQAGVERPRLAV
jgi:hypothetical protein